jgi:hypothetical protein
MAVSATPFGLTVLSVLSSFTTLARITGTLIPDVTGDFITAGTAHGKPYYQHIGGVYYLWYDSTDNLYYLSDNVDNLMSPHWYGPVGGILEGVYNTNNASGIATVRMVG